MNITLKEVKRNNKDKRMNQYTPYKEKIMRFYKHTF